MPCSIKLTLHLWYFLNRAKFHDTLALANPYKEGVIFKGEETIYTTMTKEPNENCQMKILVIWWE